MNIPNIRTKHIGKNVQRVRELKGIKQESLAQQLGITQQAVSNMEQSESLDDEKLRRIAEALGVSVDEIKNFSEELVFHNNVYDHAVVFNYVEQYLSPVEKIVELYEKIIREKDQMIKQKDEVIEMYKQQQKAS